MKTYIVWLANMGFCGNGINNCNVLTINIFAVMAARIANKCTMAQVARVLDNF